MSELALRFLQLVEDTKNLCKETGCSIGLIKAIPESIYEEVRPFLECGCLDYVELNEDGKKLLESPPAP